MSPLSATALTPAPEPSVNEATPETLLTGDPNPEIWAPVTEMVPLPEPSSALPDHVKHHVIRGTSALGASVALERGTGFLANILAARLGGASTFGAYSLAITTANQISTYAGCGIGATTVRFSGKYPHGSAGYPSLLRALSIVSLLSAAIAAAGLWLGAAPIAHLLGKGSLATLLRCAWISGAGAVLLECARGFYVGQRFVAALLSMSMIVGAGMVFLLPYAAHRHSPALMIECQGAIALAAVAFTFFFGRQLGWRGEETASQPRLPVKGMLREIWGFGVVQLAGLVGSSLAGYWATALVARSDTTLIEMSFFTIASQMRNLVSLPPSLLAEGSYAVMADPTHEATQTPQRVMALCCFAALSISVILGGLGMLVVPWGLTLLYGKTYANAGAAVALGLATAVAHMGTAPASNRLTIVSIRVTAIVNTVWAIFVAAASTLVLLHGGNAWHAMAIFFCAHVLSSGLVLLALKRLDRLPHGLLPLFALSVVSMGLLAAISVWRSLHKVQATPTALMALLLLATVAALYAFGSRFAWLPSRSFLRGLAARLPRPLFRGGSRV